MQKSYSFIQNKVLDQMSLNGTSIKFGKQPDICEYWQQIVACDDQTNRYALIDKLIHKMEANSSQNGFWSSDQEIQITFGFDKHAIYLDDKSLYYSFFDYLRSLYLDDREKGALSIDGNLVAKSIFNTIDNYLGVYNGNLLLRDKLTELNIDTMKYPSISVLKGKKCGACVEKAAIAHNLWLCMGRESYYISSTSAKFEHTKDEGHAFCIIKNKKGHFMLYDHAMSNFGPLYGNPIETLLSGEPLIIGEPFKNKGVYANACNLGREKLTED